MRHQWSLVDCAESGDAVVLKVSIEPTYTGMLVGVDPRTRATRWTIDLPWGFARLREHDADAPWSRRLGATAMLGQAAELCAVDLRHARVHWCTEMNDRLAMYADGGATILRHQPPTMGHVRETYHSRIDEEGESTASIAVPGDPPIGQSRDGAVPLHGGRLWLQLDDTAALPTDPLPLVVLDARTLRPVAGTAARTVRDALAEIDTSLPRTLALDAQQRTPLRTANPLTLVVSEARSSRVFPAAPADLVLAAVGEAVRRDGGLPADASIRPIARQGNFVLADAAHPDGARWTLIHGVVHPDEPQSPAVRLRSFDRRPTAHDVYRFLLTDHEGGVRSRRHAHRAAGDAAIDEAAWRDLTREPRDLQWQMR